MHISLYLPVATGDFSGACSALYALDCCVVVLDPKGCTNDYLMVEDPRLPDHCTRVRSARMDDVDVTMGDCAGVHSVAADMVAEHHPAFIAVVGSTVSSIIGLDVSLIAAELEEELGLPVIAVDADGFTTYAHGIHLACKALMERFGEEEPRRARSVNILGATPVDFAEEEDQALMRAAVEVCGYEVLSDWCMGLDAAQVAAAPQASVNLAVNVAGLETARWMQQRYGIPYVAYTPLTSDDAQLKALLDATLADGVSREPEDYARLTEANSPAASTSERVLLTGDEIIARSLRAWLRSQGCTAAMDIATFFAPHNAPTPGVHYLHGDLELMELQQQEAYALIAGDPLFAKIPALQGAQLFTLPHPAFSALLHREEMPHAAESGVRFTQLCDAINALG